MLIGLFELPQDTTGVSDDIPLIDPDADNAGLYGIHCSELLKYTVLIACLGGAVDSAAVRAAWLR